MDNWIGAAQPVWGIANLFCWGLFVVWSTRLFQAKTLWQFELTSNGFIFLRTSILATATRDYTIFHR